MRIVKSVTAGLSGLALLTAVTAQPALAQSRDAWDKLSTALVFGLAGGAGLETLKLDDKAGQMEFFKTMALSLALSEAIKAGVHETRPDGSSNDSFPSAHTALAFAAARYFDLRYGADNKALVPFFYGAAALTAVGRVEAKKHFVWDVAAGALIGVVMAQTFTTAYQDVAVYPTGDGVGIAYTKHF